MNAPSTTLTAAPMLLRERVANVAVLVLNRPNARNSLSEDMLVALADTLTEVADDKTNALSSLPLMAPLFAPGMT